MDPKYTETLDPIADLDFAAPSSKFADELTLTDRCDSCNAAAAAQVDVGVGAVMLFCGHHFRKNAKLATYPHKLTDDPTLHFGLGLATPLVTGLRDGGTPNL
jgi:hypothetical protein